MEKLYYDRENKKFYVREFITEKNGDILIATDEKYVDVTDEIVELFQEYIAKDGRQVLCFDTTMLQLPDTVYKEGKKLDYSGYPSVGKTREEVKSQNNVNINRLEKDSNSFFKQVHDSIIWDRGLRIGMELDFNESTKNNIYKSKVFTIEEIENFVHDHIQQKIDNNELHLTGIGNDNFEREFMIYRNALFEGIVNGISMCNNNKVEGIEDNLKSLRPQPKQERQIKEGDKVSIHCRKDREKDIIAIYDGKVGKVTDIWDKRYPWGHIAVKLDDGCNNSFHEDELEVLDESHWKPNEEQMEALNKAIPVCMGVVGRDAVVPLESLCEELEKLM